MTRALLRLRLRLTYWLLPDLFKIVPATADIVLAGEHYHKNPKQKAKELPLIEYKTQEVI